MEIINLFVDYFLHLDKHLNEIIAGYGTWTYALLFVIVFCETGLVVTPILPGDSLLFAAGALAATDGSPLNIYLIFLLLAVAAIGGDTVNYWIGRVIGPKVFQKEKSLFFNKKYLDRTHKFYEKYGSETIILARFVPIVRTFAPFVAGIGKMSYMKFISYNVVGGLMWIAIFTFGGYFFGNIPIVKNNFSIVIVAIIVLSVMPMVVEFLKFHYGKNGDD